MNRDYWKRYAWELESDLHDARQNTLFWKGCTILLAIGFMGAGVNLWLSI